MRGDVVARAMRLIADGIVDREGVTGLAARVGYTTRQLERLLQAEVGAGPAGAGPRAARADRAGADRDHRPAVRRRRVRRRLLQHPAVQRHRARGVRLTPTALRQRAHASRSAAATPAPGALSLRLPVRTPFAYEGLFGHLAATAVPGVEEVRDGAYRRTLRLPHGNGIVSLDTAARPRRLPARARRLPRPVRRRSPAAGGCSTSTPTPRPSSTCSAPTPTGAVVAKAPGQRIPRTVDERGVRRARGARPAGVDHGRPHPRRRASSRAYGQPVTDADGGLTHVFPASSSSPTSIRPTSAFPKSRHARSPP